MAATQTTVHITSQSLENLAPLAADSELRLQDALQAFEDTYPESLADLARFFDVPYEHLIKGIQMINAKSVKSRKMLPDQELVLCRFVDTLPRPISLEQVHNAAYSILNAERPAGAIKEEIGVNWAMRFLQRYKYAKGNQRGRWRRDERRETYDTQPRHNS